MSLMNYADYSQMRLGPSCGPEFLRGVADAIDGRSTVLPETAEPVDPLAADTLEGALAAEQAAESEQGSQAEHWASTTNVRRSTHGHRTPRASSAGTPKPRARKDDAE